MKTKIKLILSAIILFSSLVTKAENLDTTNYTTLKDTVIVLSRPTSEDSAKVVKIVNGVIQIATVFIKEPITNEIVNSPYVGGGLVAIILGIWRRVEKRRLRKKGLLKEK